MRRISRDLLLSLIVAPYVIAAAVLFYESDMRALRDLTHWFDPIFFQYNLLLLLFSILLVPFVTYFYITNMKGEKQRRFRNELSEAEWKEIEDYVNNIFNRRFRMRYYFGSMMMLMVLITLGASIILLLKIRPVDTFGAPYPQTGVDYGRGANMLLLGPFVQSFIEGGQKDFYSRLVISLTAFQFGFLGAYVYFIGYLTRSVFTLDLSPSTFVISSVRMATGSIVALVISFVLAELPYFRQGEGGSDLFKASLPLLSFFIGFFPSRGLLFISKLSSRVLATGGDDYASENLTKLKGMSYAHELRLTQEGYDNLENLAFANSLDLALRTGFSYQQLRQWVGEAWLRLHMKDDYEAFRNATGITGAYELLDCKAAWEEKREGDFLDCLNHATGSRFGDKIRIVTHLFETHLFAKKQKRPPVT
jgi:hypothetical protein